MKNVKKLLFISILITILGIGIALAHSLVKVEQIDDKCFRGVCSNATYTTTICCKHGEYKYSCTGRFASVEFATTLFSYPSSSYRDCSYTKYKKQLPNVTNIYKK